MKTHSSGCSSLLINNLPTYLPLIIYYILLHEHYQCIIVYNLRYSPNWQHYKWLKMYIVQKASNICCCCFLSYRFTHSSKCYIAILHYSYSYRPSPTYYTTTKAGPSFSTCVSFHHGCRSAWLSSLMNPQDNCDGDQSSNKETPGVHHTETRTPQGLCEQYQGIM